MALYFGSLGKSVHEKITFEQANSAKTVTQHCRIGNNGFNFMLQRQ